LGGAAGRWRDLGGHRAACVIPGGGSRTRSKVSSRPGRLSLFLLLFSKGPLMASTNLSLTSQVLTNIATLVTQAEAQTRIAPGGAQFYEAIITGYALGAGQRIGQL